ncbi:LCP family protein [Streptomyces sp. NPDC020412]|uniref:LCP family protein n=1 Tax=Streptomyces sp. NPDC020412 TaxID=3365073 RepID=UPI0037A77AA3
MDAQSRGRADDIDPADQWVLNPQTGTYELRLDQSPAQSSPSTNPAGAPTVPGSRTSDGRRADALGRGQAPVPGQRSHRARGGDDGAGAPPVGAGRRKRKPGASRKKKVLMWTGGSLALLMTAGGVGAYVVYQRLEGSLNTIDVGDVGTGGFKKDQAINILVLGTDKRTGTGNTSYGDRNSEGHADTSILFHVSKDRTNATALSIPRDLITDIPDCKTTDGQTIRGARDTKFNESLGVNGRNPGCTMQTVTELTGIEIDHFVMADFNAVKTLSTAVGGVEVCLAKPINDEDSKLNLPAGKHKVKGEEALAFVRTRKSVGFGSDLSRIELQQQFLSSLLREMKSSETLTSPTKMWDLANAAIKALTVDKGIGSIKKLQELGMEMSKVNPKNITFATVPVVDNEKRTAVLLQKQKAEPLFAMIRNDVSLTEVEKKEKATKKKTPGPLDGPRAEASDVRVAVYNGGGPQGAAQETLTWLQGKQVNKSSNESNAPEQAITTLEYGPNQADQARALADLLGLPATALKPKAADSVGTEPMKLVLGKDFKEPGVPLPGGKTKAPEGIQKVEADKQLCAE